MHTESMLRVVYLFAAVVPWTIERDTAAVREGDRVRLTASDWDDQKFGTVVDTWSEDDTRIACVDLDTIEGGVSFPVENLALRL